MKTFLRLSFLTALIACVGSSCQKVTKTSVYTANVPIHNDNNALLDQPGKIFLYNSLILINDFESGVHIYDNSNPSAPTHIGFINIPGNVDIAVRDNILYVDSYVDLVAIDISDPANAREVGRVRDALSYTIPSTMDWTYPVSRIDPANGVVISYVIDEVEETCVNEECKTYYTNSMADGWGGAWNGQMMTEDGSAVSFSGNANNVRSSSSSTGNSGIAGSMARFMLIDNFLYVISDQSTVTVFDITSQNIREVASFRPWDETGNAFGVIETLFTFKNHLFIGANMGMLAYDVSNPAQPVYLSNYSHMTACDPVVANDDYAFVTLRSGNNCNWGNSNQLDILDIENIMDPILLKSVAMTNPKGLDIDSDQQLVFVCDGWDGLKVYDFASISDIEQKRLNHLAGFDTYDIILNNGIAHVIGDDGLKQFSYDEMGALTELSTIALD
jgi:hypothetical protein